MERALVVSSTEKGRAFLLEILAAGGCRQPASARSGAEARRLLSQWEYDLVLVNAPLSDEFGHELAVDGALQSAAGVILLVKSELADELSAKVEDAGVFVVPKPVSRPFFFQALRLVQTARQRVVYLRQENARLQSKMEEIRLVDRAKCALIQYQHFDEATAHRYIEKQAMDRRVTRGEVARAVLEAYPPRPKPGEGEPNL